MANTIAPETPNSMGRTRFTIAVAVCSLPLRCEYGFRGTKMSPWFAAAPAKLKPATENVPSDSDTCANMSETFLPMSLVYSSEAPDGAWTTIMKYP